MKKILYLSILSTFALLLACSGSSDSETTNEETKDVTKSTVNVTMKEWEVNVDPNYKMGKHISPGELTLTLTNEGLQEHNLILLNDSKHEDLPLTSDESMVDESKFDILGTIASLQPGKSGKLVVENLPAGTYALICNIPGHYAHEMVYKFIAR